MKKILLIALLFTFYIARPDDGGPYDRPGKVKDKDGNTEDNDNGLGNDDGANDDPPTNVRYIYLGVAGAIGLGAYFSLKEIGKRN